MVHHIIEEEALNEFKKTLVKTIDAIFDEKFPANPDGFKCSRCDYAGICDAKDTLE